MTTLTQFHEEDNKILITATAAGAGGRRSKEIKHADNRQCATLLANKLA